jgi:hypothetical protein
MPALCVLVGCVLWVLDWLAFFPYRKQVQHIGHRSNYWVSLFPSQTDPNSLYSVQGGFCKVLFPEVVSPVSLDVDLNTYHMIDFSMRINYRGVEQLLMRTGLNFGYSYSKIPQILSLSKNWGVPFENGRLGDSFYPLLLKSLEKSVGDLVAQMSDEGEEGFLAFQSAALKHVRERLENWGFDGVSVELL